MKIKEYKELICVIGVVILVAAIILVRKYNGNKTDKVEDIHIDVDTGDIQYATVSGRGHKYTIYNKETIQEIIDKINAETIVKNGKKHQFSTSDYGIGIYTAGGEHIGLVIGRESAGYNGRKYYFQDEGKLQDEIRDMLKYCGRDLPIIKADEDVEFSAKGIEFTQNEAIGEYNTLLTAKPIEKEQFKESDQYYCIKTAYSQEIYVYYVENEIYIKYTDYHAGVSDVDENGNEVPIVKQWYYVIDKIQQ